MGDLKEEEEVIEEEVEDNNEAEVNALEMSDEDFMNQPIPNEQELEVEETDEEEEDNQETAEEDAAEKTSDEEDETDSRIDSKSSGNVDAKDGGKDAEKGEKTPPEIDYKAEHEKLFAPFKANGREMSVSSTDDIRRLMEMGANYNKKMAGLKPNLKLLKMLENNGLLDESKLSYLIDLDKKNPGAINKMVKDSGIDPLDINPDEEAEYKPNTYTVDDSQVDLDTVLDEIRETPTFQDTIDTISNKWDESSKEVLLKEPSIIKVINDHKAPSKNGGLSIYDQITGVVESEKMLGRLKGLSDLEAYKTVGDAIQAVGGFIGQAPRKSNQANDDAQTPSDTNKLEDPKLKSRKKAAGAAKNVQKGNKGNQDFNPLSLSDEEFEKISSSQYM